MAYKDLERGYWVGETRVKSIKGEIKKRKKRGFKTKREALEWEQSIKFIDETPVADMKLEEFIDIYFKDKEHELKERTKKNKRYMMDKNIIPYIGKKKMGDITPHDLIEWQQCMISNNYSETYLRMIQNQMTCLFTHACKIYDMKNNPCKKVKKIGKSDVRRLEFWTKAEYDLFISTLIPGTMYYVLFEVLFYTGMRIGEALALFPEDFDFQNTCIHIKKTYYRTKKMEFITEPKTEGSIRDIVIPTFLVQELQEYISRRQDNSERVFPVGHEAVQHKLKRQIEKAEVPAIPVHGLRHSAVAYLISKGIPPMVIKERVGHKDIQMTLNTYGHLYPNEQHNLVNLLDKEYKFAL